MGFDTLGKLWILKLFLCPLIILRSVDGFMECSNGSDTAKKDMEYLVSPFFPKMTKRALKCKFSISVNYGEYIKLFPDVIELPCVGGNGIYVEEEGGRSGPFCGNMRMPELVSRDVKFDIHVIIDTPVRGARIKIGYKTVTSPKGANLDKLTKNAKVPLAMAKMAPDQGQGMLQQQNQQNMETDVEKNELALLGNPFAPDLPGPGYGPRKPKPKPKGNRRGYVEKKAKKYESPTYNPVSNYNWPKSAKPAEEESSVLEVVIPILFLIILIAILIFVVHKRRQKMKEDLKKVEAVEKSENFGNSTPLSTVQKTHSMDKTEPTMDQINHVIEADTIASKLEDSEESTILDAPKIVKTQNYTKEQKNKTMNKKTVSDDSGAGSQATTAPSIRTECLKTEPENKPDLPIKAPAARPSRNGRSILVMDADRPDY